ncbi:MAG: SDR family oxidoreductase [Bacteroidetes bacterium]|nr:SDR family oxidoreductase [Bacteroidota bacterium]
MKEIAIVTGASSGIGHEIAKLFAKDQIDILIVARDEKKLLEIKKSFEEEYKINVFTVAADLSKNEGIQAIHDMVSSKSFFVRYLVNNAGFGDYGKFVDRSMEKYREMIHLNMLSLTELTYYYGKEMVRKGSGKIMNVASMAGLQPDPNFAVYGATKAYVISLSEAIHKEFENTGVSVTVLSPGATETNFMERADMRNAKIYEKGGMTSRDVALEGYNGMMKGKLHVIPGFKNKILGFLSGITPSGKLRLNIAAKVMASKKK